MQTPEKSLSWRCSDCGRLRLAVEPLPRPSRCSDCGGIALQAAGPFSDAWDRFQGEQDAVGWPAVERRKSARG